MTGNVAERPLTEQKTRFTRRTFLKGSTAAAVALALYSSEIARHELSILTHRVGIENLPGAFEGFRIAQISDIHFEEYTEELFLCRVIHEVNALRPDLVVLTGDFISQAPLRQNFVLGAMERCGERLSAIACPRRFAVMGNHDFFLGVDVIRPILAGAGIPLLVDEHFPIERGGRRLWLSGITDPVSQSPELYKAIPEQPDGPVLLMSHGPDYADTVHAHPRGRFVDLMLAGHSHGGQVRLPLVGALHTPDGAKKYVEGFFRFGRMQLYVNRGIGAVGLPFRLNCPPEITVFTLTRA